ncbi:MAG: hypothetical protein HY866_06145 [Chloroflexi bacterium]|nr:hypothetical protein [Chloroflexota bacterium]
MEIDQLGQTMQTQTRQRMQFRVGIIVVLSGALGLCLLSLLLTDRTWRAIAYGMVALFGFLTVLAIYFWGSILFGGIVEMVNFRRNTGRWGIGGRSEPGSPEHDLDPGLELISAGILVYILGEVKPRVHFRKVPLANVRSIRPFIVARTGDERAYQFQFALVDDSDKPCFHQDFSVTVRREPQMITPPQRLMFNKPRKVIGQRWSLQVRSGMTIITSLRFMFVEGGGRSSTLLEPASSFDLDVADPVSSEQQELLNRLLDQVIKNDAMTNTLEIVLEEV